MAGLDGVRGGDVLTGSDGVRGGDVLTGLDGVSGDRFRWSEGWRTGCQV